MPSVDVRAFERLLFINGCSKKKDDARNKLLVSQCFKNNCNNHMILSSIPFVDFRAFENVLFINGCALYKRMYRYVLLIELISIIFVNVS